MRDEEFGRGQNTELGWNDLYLARTSYICKTNVLAQN